MHMTTIPDVSTGVNVTGAPCWVDLLTSDTQQARDFYPQLFGWTALEPSPEFGGYFMFTKDDVPVAGCMPVPEGVEEHDVWSTYLAVADARATAERAASAGARVAVPVMDVADLGASGLLTDPTGARVGIWQADTFSGLQTTGPGTPVGAPAYFELHTRDYDTALAFYRDVMGWDVRERDEVPGLRYATLGEGDASAGIMDATAYLADGEHPAWNVYFATDDVDRSTQKAEQLGGTVRMPAMDTPFGRVASVTDPAGARLTLLGPVTG
jgi:predicted enzyme related to lactoylglutathione lyase